MVRPRGKVEIVPALFAPLDLELIALVILIWEFELRSSIEFSCGQENNEFLANGFQSRVMIRLAALNENPGLDFSNFERLELCEVVALRCISFRKKTNSPIT